MNIACVQMDIAFGAPEKNKQTVVRYMEQIAKEADVVVLPELWTTGYDLTRLTHIADENGEQTKAFLSELARTYRVHIVGGSVAKKVADNITNTMYIVHRNGDVVCEYSKLHLFKLMDEHKHLQAGETTGIFSLDGVTGAGVICYDIRFPEWIRAHTLNGAEVLFVVAEWPFAPSSLAHVINGASDRKSMLRRRVQPRRKRPEQHVCWAFDDYRSVGKYSCRRKRTRNSHQGNDRHKRSTTRTRPHPDFCRSSSRRV